MIHDVTYEYNINVYNSKSSYTNLFVFEQTLQSPSQFLSRLS
jgi:hypothetical protein